MDSRPIRLQEELSSKKDIIMRELKYRTLFWFVRLRWWVPPSVLAAVTVGRLVGIEFSVGKLLAVALFILAYNMIFYVWSRRFRGDQHKGVRDFYRFAYWQVSLDYIAMFLLLHFTGGAASPLIFFFIFHIIFASILLSSRSAYIFSGLVVGGMSLIALAEYLGWIPNHPILIGQTTIRLAQEPFYLMVELGFFSASVFITAFSATAIMTMLRKRIADLGILSDSVTVLNSKLRALFSMTQAIGSPQHLDEVLQLVTSELQVVMNVRGISVKMLSEDGRFLRYAAAYGLPEEFVKGKEVEVEKSPLNRSIIEGDPYLTGNITEKDKFQFGEALAAAKIKSVLFVPLTGEDRVIGILGAYCVYPDRFRAEDVEFFRLAAGLVAIALENAKAYEAIEELVRERSWYVMRMTHNMRAPLSAVLSILEDVRGRYSGELKTCQREYLDRLDRSAQSLLLMINELMTLAESRNESSRAADPLVDLTVLANRVKETFQDEAAKRRVKFKIVMPVDPPGIRGDAGMVEQMLENLVSNAIKYTFSGGQVTVAVHSAVHAVKIEVSDTGIGIPVSAISNIFNEFFRAENARAVVTHGTGLGLAIVKEVVNKHGGRILVQSEEGLGTIFVVHLPVARHEDRSAEIRDSGNMGQ